MTRRHTADRVVLSPEQREQLDAAILQAVKSQPNGIRSSELLCVPSIQSVIGTLPTGKSDMRYLDGALQRLRANRLICTGAERGATNKWFQWSPRRGAR